MKKLVLTLVAFAFVANLSAQVEVKSTGVGIGTTNPQYPLDVVGTIRVGGDIYFGGSTNLISATNNFGINFKTNNNLAGSTGNAISSSVSFGYQALSGQIMGVGGNVAVGFQALYSNTTGSSNTSIGSQALYSNTYGQNNTAIGSNALYSNTGGTHNAAIGSSALYSNIDGYSNIAIGSNALLSNTYGNNNIAIGWNSLSCNTTGIYNTAIGSSALFLNTTGNFNTAIGNSTLYLNTTGSNNNAIGYSSLSLNSTGSNNTAIGKSALASNSTGNDNTAISQDALTNNTTGNQNIAIGNGALAKNTTGSLNIAIGSNAHASNLNGNQNIVIGDFTFGSIGNLNNIIAIGSGAAVSASNQVRIGNNSMTSIGGQVAWSTFSDGRTKKNVKANVPGLAFINRLQPVTYNLDLDAIDVLFQIDQMSNLPDSLMRPMPQELIDINIKAREAKEREVQTGFVAQDVETIAKSLGYDFSGVEVDESGIYSLRYGEFVVPLVKAVQELSEQNERLQKQVDELTLLVNRLLGSE